MVYIHLKAKFLRNPDFWRYVMLSESGEGCNDFVFSSFSGV